MGPTIKNKWGDPRVVRRPPKAVYLSDPEGWAPRQENGTFPDRESEKLSTYDPVSKLHDKESS
jgi:hypothetical protein